jgi:glycerophosphoryl diester phosphodiesterase
MPSPGVLSALRRAPNRRPLVLGHRGARHAAPENTMAAFELALSEGADGVELDVRLDGSGRVVVAHDVDLSRVSGGTHRGLIHELSREELGRVELSGGQFVPALADVLVWARAHDTRVNVELKGDAPDLRSLARAVVELVRDLGAPPERIWFSSFHPWLVRAMARSLPSHATCWLVHQGQRAFRDGNLFGVLGAVGVHPERVLVTPERVATWRRRGALIHTWTVNDPAEAERLSSFGVDGIISDNPARVLEVL